MIFIAVPHRRRCRGDDKGQGEGEGKETIWRTLHTTARGTRFKCDHEREAGEETVAEEVKRL